MSAPNLTVAAARVIVDELTRNQVRHMVIAPGSRSAALAMAAAEHSLVDLTVEIDERSAAFFALGIARESGRPAVVITTSGTAVANLLPAVAEADLDSIPLLLLTADRPPELHDVGANQTMDQVQIFGRRVRWFCGLGVPEAREDANAVWRSAVCQAVAKSLGAVDAVAGPVHINLPLREPSVPVGDDGRSLGVPYEHGTDGREDGGPWTGVGSSGWRVVSTDPIDDERVVVVAAGDAFGRHLVEDAERHGWPVIAEPQSSARTVGAITTAHHFLQDASVAAELRPDVVIEIGRAGLSRAVRSFLDGAARRIVIHPRWADATRTADGWSSSWVPWPRDQRGPGAWYDRWRDLELTARTALDEALDRSGLSEARVARDTARALPEGCRLVAASSMPIRDLDLAMEGVDLRVHANRGVSGIDGFVSTVFGIAAIASEPTVALAGDLSILHDANGFLVTPRPDAVFVVVNNDGGGIFSFLPQSGYPDVFERVFGTPHGRSFAELAAFHGLDHTLVGDPARLIPEIRRCIDLGGVHLVEVRTNRASNVSEHRALTAAVLAAL